MENITIKLKDRNTDLKDRELEGLLNLLLNSDAVTVNDIVHSTGLPKETVRRFVNTSPDILEGSEDGVVTITKDALPAVKELNPREYQWSIYTNLNPEMVNKLKEIRQKHNLQPKREFDQFFATEETSVKKALVMESKLDLNGKSVALLGDDDLVSITLNMLENPPKDITVFDIDAEILTSIEAISKEMGINNIHTKIYDARNAPDMPDLGNFDVIMTDPPYTKTGITIFLNRCIQLLRIKDTFEANYIYLFYGNSFKSPEKTLKVQEVISQFNLVIEDKIDKFARYYGAESIGSAGSLYILKTTPFTKPLEEAMLTQSIYTFENQAEEKFPYVDHYTFKLLGVPGDILNSKNKLMKLTGQFCTKHKLNVVETKLTRFKGGGYTLTYVLSTSNLLVHSWPEHNAVHIDLVTCSPIHHKEYLTKNLLGLFNAKNIETRKIE